MESELFKIIAAGGDIGIWVAVFVYMKIDKRLTVLETKAA